MKLPTEFDDDILGYETGFGASYPVVSQKPNPGVFMRLFGSNSSATESIPDIPVGAFRSTGPT